MSNILSAACISPYYQFTNENCLVECAKILANIGINAIKFSLVPKNINIVTSSNIKTLAQLVQQEPSYRYVLDMPEMKTYVIWAYTMNSGVLKDGMSEPEKITEYTQIYDLTKYLLTQYSGTGKTFLLGNWESDWGALGVSGYDGEDPDPVRVQALRDYFNIRQKAVDDAKASSQYANVQVYHYAEIVMVKDIIENKDGFNKRCLNAVIPYVPALDYISWSAYTIQDDDPTTIRKLLDFVEYFLPTAKAHIIPGKRVFIGEFGWKYLDGITAAYRMAKFVKTVFDWGCPYALFWELYSNEKNTTFNLIRPDGSKTEKYELMRLFWENNRNNIDECMSKLELERLSNMHIIHDCFSRKCICDDEFGINHVCLKDYATLDMNGYNQTMFGLSNVGICSRVTNSSATMSVLTFARGNKIAYGSYATGVFSGVRNGYGNSRLSGNMRLCINDGEYVANAVHDYTQGTEVRPGASLYVRSDGALGSGSLTCYGSVIFECTLPIDTSATISLAKSCIQMRTTKSCSYNNTIIIDSDVQGVTGCGLIEPQNNTILCLSGYISINGTPKRGAHFGAPPGSSMIISGFITSSVPVIWRRGLGTVSGGGKYTAFVIAQGTITLGATNGISKESLLTMGTHGESILDMNGFDQCFANVCTSTYKSYIVNNGSKEATLIYNGNIRILYPNDTILLKE